MSFELPRAARGLRFSGELHVPNPSPNRALGVAQAPAPLARPRPLTAARVAAFGVDDDEQPTHVHPSALAPAAPPERIAPRTRDVAMVRDEGRTRHRAIEANPRPIPNFRAAPAVLPVLARAGSAASAKDRRRRAAPTVQTGHARRPSAPRGLSALAWVCLAIIGAAISFHAAPPLASRLGLVAAR